MTEATETLRETARRKTLIMERSIAQLRALVIGTNITAYFLFLGPGSPRWPLALTIIVVATLYAVWSSFTKPFERYPLLRFGAFTLTTDALLTTLWVLATGGPQSPFWVIYFVSVVSVGMRYDLAQTIAAAIGEAMLYIGVLTLDGGAPGLTLMVRPIYIGIVGLAAGLLARQERLSREERIRFQRLAVEHAELLGRERETVEMLRRLDQMKTEFVASASHELRTPLTTLSGLATTLAVHGDKMDEAMFTEALNRMRRQGDRARVLIENLLDLSQLEHGSAQLQLSPTSIRSAMAGALEVAPPPKDKHVDLECDDDILAMADRSRLEQVLTNLLTNAYRYGGSNITVRAFPENGSVLMAVSDDGAGLPEDLLPRLFQPFGRGDNVNGQTGSGLGLAISHKLIEAFGGRLAYEAADRGARFVIELPRAS